MSKYLNIAKVSALPQALASQTMYLVDGGDSNLEIHVTSNDGSKTLHVPTRTEIDSLIGTAIAGFQSIRVVPDYLSMTGLIAESRSMVVMVLDATGDTTVTTGGAAYILEATGTAEAPGANIYKIYEFEALSENFRLDWENIIGRPTSSAADVDDAVAKRHSHANINDLNRIGHNADNMLTIDGKTIDPTFLGRLGTDDDLHLTFDGVTVGNPLAANEW